MLYCFPQYYFSSPTTFFSSFTPSLSFYCCFIAFCFFHLSSFHSLTLFITFITSTLLTSMFSFLWLISMAEYENRDVFVKEINLCLVVPIGYKIQLVCYHCLLQTILCSSNLCFKTLVLCRTSLQSLLTPLFISTGGLFSVESILHQTQR